jgi:outer membrane protein assembly factor BamD
MALGEAAETKGNLKAALNYYKEISKKYGGSKYSPEALYRTAKIRFGQRKWKKSFAAFNSVIVYYPDYEKFNLVLTEQFEIATALMEDKTSRYFGVIPYHNFESAVRYFEVIVRNAPYSDYAPLALMNVGLIHKKKKNEIFAIDAFDRLINTYPRSLLAPEAYLALADTFADMVAGSKYDQGATEEAIRYFQDFMILFPESPRIAEAEDRLNEMQEVYSRSKYEIAEFYLKKRNYYPGAKQFFNEAITVAPNSETAEEARVKLAAIPDEEEQRRTAQANRSNAGKKGIIKRINPFGSKRRDAVAKAVEEAEAAELAAAAAVTEAVAPEEAPEVAPTPLSGTFKGTVTFDSTQRTDGAVARRLAPVSDVPSGPVATDSESTETASISVTDPDVDTVASPNRREIKREQRRLKRERKREEAAAVQPEEEKIGTGPDTESSIGEVGVFEGENAVEEGSGIVIAEDSREEAIPAPSGGNSIGEFVFFNPESLASPAVDEDAEDREAATAAPIESEAGGSAEEGEEAIGKKSSRRSLLFWKKNRKPKPDDQAVIE